MSALADAFMGIFGMTRVKTKTCPICKQVFEPFKPLQKTCCWECALELVKKKRIAEEVKADRKEIRLRKEKLKTKRDYTKEAQIAWNFYVRMRDLGKPCVSCGSMPDQKYGGTMDCSHYRSVGAAPHLRFHLHNAASACVKCNRYLAGNVVELRRGLIERIGLEKVEAIEANNETRKYSIEYLKRIKAIFTKRGNMLARRAATR